MAPSEPQLETPTQASLFDAQESDDAQEPQVAQVGQELETSAASEHSSGPSSGHWADGQNEFDAEQQAILDAYGHLEAMRHSARQLPGNVISEAGGTHQARYERDVMGERSADRLSRLELGGESLVFGRIDREDGERFHIGRMSVTDPAHNPIVVDWRAPVAEPFYRATGRNPLGLTRRRHLTTSGETLIAMDDEVFSVDMLASDDKSLVGTAALLSALGRARSSHMRDIVATIQVEQDEIIRSDMHGVMVVQGGPGTGKTAVALHRASYLLYAHRFPLERQGVLVVGPNRTFMRYISRVLPSLGETGVEMAAIDQLVHGVEVKQFDSPAVAMLKGDPRMVKFIRRAVNTRQRALKTGLVVGYAIYQLRLDAEELEELVVATRRTNRLHNAARRHLLSLITDRLYQRYAEALERSGRRIDDTNGGAKRADFTATIKSDGVVKAALERMWPLLTPEILLRDLFGAPALIRAASKELLNDAEQALLERSRGESLDEVQWTSADVALLDEAATHIGPLPTTAHVVHDADHRPRLADGTSTDDIRTYGHIVVDEGQDLSPMQLRMLTRRSLSGSITIVGDIGQATGMWAPKSWADVLRHLPGKKKPRIEELSVGYRTPAEIMSVAARVLAVAAPGLRVPKSVRSVGYGPSFESVTDVRSALAKSFSDLRARVGQGTVGVIAPDDMCADVLDILRADGVSADTGDGITGVSVISVRLSKGLEFDGVMVIEPGMLANQSANGLRGLFVALTRPTQALTILHATPLPPCLVEDQPAGK